ncbi:hypothetical protein SynRS9909_01666 [Synechococcus sp. RS9909]|uniref:HepT-like ribonuclease domain-containing protein n=1 Tax=unclassified Synechococcus TaxID=2626047 RepID=UPI000068F7A7|nr:MULTISPECIES: hypothetical protein [unclassified Synechococcus]EAQ69092.1 hypothetical protein RS9917_11650 [Synechococcus sp. RS9917]QNI79650.1 hypothetical protein SynRS9909_01666 [Synechococcus sp. RS9909]
MNKDRLYLESIRDCLERIAEYTAPGEQAFLTSRLIQDGVIRNLEVNLARVWRTVITDLPPLTMPAPSWNSSGICIQWWIGSPIAARSPSPAIAPRYSTSQKGWILVRR